MGKTIIISGYFGGSAQERKLDYFERLDEALRPAGYRLLLANLGGLSPKTICKCVNCPTHVMGAHEVRVGSYLNLDGLPHELMQAACVEAATLEVSPVSSGLKAVLISAYMRDLLLEEKPSLCVMWHEFNIYHHVLTHVCQKLGIPYLYAEYGVLPGTINFDEGGQMAESWVAQCPREFSNLPVDGDDLSRGQAFLDLVRGLKKSRKPQETDLSIHAIVEQARDRGRKIIFYAGQNDWCSGMLPRWLPRAKEHSPIYTDTIDALKHLSELAEKNDWHIIFKPHPDVETRHKGCELPYPNRVDLALGANVFECIEESDITTTILSQVSYHALIQRRPCVLLGSNHLHKKGCTFQPARREQVEKELQVALQYGFDEERETEWERHVAQLCKYYVFAMDLDVAEIIGRSVDEAAHHLIGEVDRLQSTIETGPGASGFGRLQHTFPSAGPPFRVPLRWKIRAAAYTLHYQARQRGWQFAQSLPSPIYKGLRLLFRTWKHRFR